MTGDGMVAQVYSMMACVPNNHKHTDDDIDASHIRIWLLCVHTHVCVCIYIYIYIYTHPQPEDLGSSGFDPPSSEGFPRSQKEVPQFFDSGRFVKRVFGARIQMSEHEKRSPSAPDRPCTLVTTPNTTTT